jgi:hypothetical protein
MRLTFIAIAVAFGGISMPTFAHPEGHDEYLAPTPVPVTELAQTAVRRLVSESKLPASWTAAKLMGRELRTKDGKLQWVVIFQNDAERRERRHMLYVLMSTGGAFISADHTLS